MTGHRSTLMFLRVKSRRRRSALVAGPLLVLALLTGCNLPLTPLPATPPAAPGFLSVPSEYLTGARIVSHDPLKSTRGWKYERDTGAVVNGVFVMQGTPFWHSHLSYVPPIHEGHGVMLSFEAQQADAESELVLVSGEWLTASFRQFGLYNAARPQADLFQGTRDLGGYAVMGDLALQPQTWYDAVLAAGFNGRLLAVIWDPADPARRAIFDLAGGPGWAGRSWTFMPKANAGETLSVDDFYTIAFTAIK